jgi:hypothetical protein
MGGETHAHLAFARQLTHTRNGTANVCQDSVHERGQEARAIAGRNCDGLVSRRDVERGIWEPRKSGFQMWFEHE